MKVSDYKFPSEDPDQHGTEDYDDASESLDSDLETDDEDVERSSSDGSDLDEDGDLDDNGGFKDDKTIVNPHYMGGMLQKKDEELSREEDDDLNDQEDTVSHENSRENIDSDKKESD